MYGSPLLGSQVWLLRCEMAAKTTLLVSFGRAGLVGRCGCGSWYSCDLALQGSDVVEKRQALLEGCLVESDEEFPDGFDQLRGLTE